MDPAAMDTAALYQLMTNAVVPRPIALVSTVSASGVPNLAPFSFFMVGGVNPASLVFCPVRSGVGHKKDTLRNVEETKEYVINLVDRAMAAAMNETSAPLDSTASEWGRTDFTAQNSVQVRPKCVAESPISFEMKLFEIIHHGDGPSSASYVIGEAVALHVRADLATEAAGRFSLISRLGGVDYLDLASMEIFGMERPKS